jgi:predicted PurR-regulated permease PerM
MNSDLNALIRPLLVMLLLIAITVILYFGKGFLIPIAYGVVFALLVNPIDNKLRSWGLNKWLSAMISVSVILLFVVILFSALGWQIQQLSEQSDQIKKEFVEKQEQAQTFIKNQFGLSLNQQEEYAGQSVDNWEKQAKTFVGTTAGALIDFMLALVYAIFFLGAKTRIKDFIFRIYDRRRKAKKSIGETTQVVQKYLTGKLLVMGILAVLYWVGFMLLGIQYAILLAVLTALLGFIPFIGNFIGAFLAALIALATGSSMTDILIIFAIITVAQLAENYLLTPWILGDNINLNPLFSILTVMALSLIWGAGGAIIALPLAAIVKNLMSHFETYEPVAFLMDTEE